MVNNDDINETTLNAYVDRQLDPELQQAILRAIHSDARIRQRVGQLRMTKDWMRTGFAASRAKTVAPPRYRGAWHRAGAAVSAAVMVLAVGFSSGVLGYLCADKGVFGGAVQDQPQRIVLHLDQSQPERFRAVLDYAEQFLRQYSEAGAQVEVVANANGIDLVTSGVSPYEKRVRTMMRQYPNLHFIACANSIRQLRKRGSEALMITDVHSSSTALDHIVSRLRDGWSYRKIDDLGAI
jgi:intracellular sulfur oxidation DsrE/DsrF family protein